MIPLGVLASRRAAPVPLQFVGANNAPVPSVTIPTHQAGDLLVMSSAGDWNVPSLPSGWTSIGTFATASDASEGRLAYRVATASGTTSGTWTNANFVQVAVYRGQHPTTPIGAHSFRESGWSSTVRFPALSGMQSAGSWVLCGVDHWSYNESASWPSGLVERVDRANYGGLADTNGVVTSWPLSGNFSMGSSGGYLAFSLEIRGG